MARRTRNVLTTLLLLGVVGSVAGWGVYSAFTATTSNSGNTITAGTVSINQHAGSTTLYSASNQGPGATTVACVRVTYGGSLASSVKLYSSSVTNGTAFNLQVERGSGLSSPDNTMNCAGFTSSSTAYNGALGSFAGTYAGGVDGKAGGTAWNTSDSVDYRFTMTVVDDPTPNAHTSALSSGAHSFTWEARNN
jgi:putative cofactor-binding repeat protein